MRIFISMKIQARYIGVTMFSKKLNMNIQIEDNPSLYAFYKQIGFNIFEDDKDNKGVSKHGGTNTNRKGNPDKP